MGTAAALAGRVSVPDPPILERICSPQRNANATAPTDELQRGRYTRMLRHLILVPTEMERRGLDLILAPAAGPDCRVALCGFGPVAAAARTAHLLMEHAPERVLLVGIAGRLNDRLTLGENFEFQAIPLHPHSFSMHVWLETGLVGACLAALAILAAGIIASRTLGHSKAAAAAAVAAMATVGTIWNVSYGAWQEWWIAAAFTAAAAAALARR